MYIDALLDQAVYRFLNKKESGISGPQHAQSRKNVVEYVRALKLCTKKEEFFEKKNTLPKDMPTPEVTRYLIDNWVNGKWGHRWSNYGRHFFHEDHDTNNLVERFFLSMKYHFLGGYGNHRVEDLLILLHGNVAMFHDYLDELARNGRLKSIKHLKEEKVKQAAESMMKAGMDKFVQWTSKTECVVPSQRAPQKFYDVDIVNIMCNCPASTQKGMCKHVHLAQMIASLKNIDVAMERKNQAVTIFNEGQYFHDKENEQVEIIPKSGLVSIVNLKTYMCSCFASSHGITCTCVIVAKMVVPQSDLQSCPEAEIEEENMIIESVDESILKKIQEINLFVSSENFQTVTERKKRMVLQALSRAYNICRLTNYCKKTRKRKIQPLFPNRTSKIPKNDHDYPLTKKRVLTKPGRKLNEDGSFKMTNRNKGCTRKPFQ